MSDRHSIISAAGPVQPGDLASMQSLVREAGLDGWLLYDFRGLNPLASHVLGLGEAMLTRRWFLFIPSQGRPQLLVHHIEADTMARLLPDPSIVRVTFSAHTELDAALRAMLERCRRVAMEYSPAGAVPYVSLVDAGTMERVRACGVEVVSSADLLQHFLIWTPEDRAAHERAVAGVIAAKDAGFQLLHARLCAGQTVTESEVQTLIASHLRAAGLEFDHPAIVAFGSHASEGHYTITPASDRPLEMGMCVLMDIWAGERDRPMADITWVGYAGQPTEEYWKVWECVRDARDRAITLLTEGKAHEGWEVDRAARDLITARGYGQAFHHRLGHSLGRNHPHGPCANLDDLETHDTRRLLPGLAVTVEPGIYLGHLGVRSEVNVLLTPGSAIVTTPIQQAPYILGTGESL